MRSIVFACIKDYNREGYTPPTMKFIDAKENTYFKIEYNNYDDYGKEKQQHLCRKLSPKLTSFNICEIVTPISREHGKYFLEYGGCLYVFESAKTLREIHDYVNKCIDGEYDPDINDMGMFDSDDYNQINLCSAPHSESTLILVIPDKILETNDHETILQYIYFSIDEYNYALSTVIGDHLDNEPPLDDKTTVIGLVDISSTNDRQIDYIAYNCGEHVPDLIEQKLFKYLGVTSNEVISFDSGEQKRFQYFYIASNKHGSEAMEMWACHDHYSDDTFIVNAASDTILTDVAISFYGFQNWNLNRGVLEAIELIKNVAYTKDTVEIVRREAETYLDRAITMFKSTDKAESKEWGSPNFQFWLWSRFNHRTIENLRRWCARYK